MSRGPHEWSSTAAFVDLPIVRERSTLQQSYDDARDVDFLDLRDDIGPSTKEMIFVFTHDGKISFSDTETKCTFIVLGHTYLETVFKDILLFHFFHYPHLQEQCAKM